MMCGEGEHTLEKVQGQGGRIETKPYKAIKRYV